MRFSLEEVIFDQQETATVFVNFSPLSNANFVRSLGPLMIASIIKDIQSLTHLCQYTQVNNKSTRLPRNNIIN